MPDPSALVAKMRDLTVRVISQESRALKDAADYIEASEKREAALRALCDDYDPIYESKARTDMREGRPYEVEPWLRMFIQFVDEIRAIYPEWGKAEA